ncbi:glycosyltransferase [Paeniglutamicibacter gangotriensis]|nr:glycosyltransferase [Paeniglutamicibacter gangotriensis]
MPTSYSRDTPLVSQPETAHRTDRAALMVTWAVEEDFGGMTTMCLKRAGLFHERGIPSAVVTFNANPDLESIRSTQRTRGRLHPDVPLLNLHEYYAARTLHPISPTTGTPDTDEIPWQESARQSRNVDGSLFFIDYQHPSNDMHSLREYFRRDGSTYLRDTSRPSAKDPDRAERRLQLLAIDGSVVHDFNSAAKLYRHWLTELADSTDADVIIDSKYAAGFLIAWNHPTALKFVNFHSTHVAAGADTLTGKLSPAHAKIIEHRDTWDGITFLTESQRSAFVQRFGQGSNTVVISNPVDAPSSLPPFEARNPAKVLHVGRFTKGKNIGAVIDIVNAVAASNTSVLLDLIGDGNERPRLEEHVRELGIAHLVTFLGHVQDVPNHLSSARALLLCSRFEGQSLAILEAQAYGCVPVAFDVDFGPRDVITNGRNGFLAPFGDQATAATALSTLLDDDAVCERMSVQGFETARTFSSDAIFTHWTKALDMARANKKIRLELAAATVRLTGLKFHSDGDFDLEVYVGTRTVELDGLSLQVTERGTDATRGRPFAPYQNADGIYTFRLPAGLRAQLPGSDALDVNVILEVAGLKRTIRLGAAPKMQSVPYFTTYGNLSFK